MKKTALTLIAAWLVISIAYSQTKPMFSQYMFNMLTLNPAYAGNRNSTAFTGIFRKQWLGIDGAPTTFMASVDGRVNNWGLGLQLYNDELGIEKTTGLHAYTSLHIPLSFEDGGTTLSVGLGFGVMNYRALYTQAQPGLYQQGDPAFSKDVKGWEPNAGLGFLLHAEKWYVGLSAPALIRTQILNNNQLNVSSLLQNNEIFLTGGYIFGNSDENNNKTIKWKPSVLVKMASGAPIQCDFNLNVWFNNYFAIGASYRTGDAVVGLVELQATPQFRIGYSYDYTVSQLNAYSRGTHEIMLRYEIGEGGRGVTAPIRYY